MVQVSYPLEKRRNIMFWKKDPKKELEKRYQGLMKEAMELQRSGKIPEFAKKSAEAEGVLAEIQAISA